MKIITQHYLNVDTSNLLSDELVIIDHLGGFTSELDNKLLDKLKDINFSGKILTQYVIDAKLKEALLPLDISMSVDLQEDINFKHFYDYTVHPPVKFENFLCSFNGSAHVSRQLLTAILHKFELFDTEYCSKNFRYLPAHIDGHLENLQLTDDEVQLNRKFFTHDDVFSGSIQSFGHVRFDHFANIYNLEDRITKSFIHLVSETMATSYYPYVTEKFLYSIATRGLFVAYGQPNWHKHVEEHYGFKMYNKIFNYTFDAIQNPVERLVELIAMLAKFSKLSRSEWHDLYLMECDTIEYNYNHYYSKSYITHMKKYACV